MDRSFADLSYPSSSLKFKKNFFTSGSHKCIDSSQVIFVIHLCSFLIVVRCSSLQAPNDGNVSPSSCTTSPEYGTTCGFSCQKGYRLQGEPTASCLREGQWSKNTSVSCEGQFMVVHQFYKQVLTLFLKRKRSSPSSNNCSSVTINA